MGEFVDIGLSSFTDFEWDNVLIFNYPTTEREIISAIGIECKVQTDLTSGMIFLKNEEIVHIEHFDYDYNGPGKFMIYAQSEIGEPPLYRLFSVENVHFLGKKNKTDRYIYYRLYPVSYGSAVSSQ